MYTLYKIQRCTWTENGLDVIGDVGYALSLEGAHAVLASIINSDIITPRLQVLKHNTVFLAIAAALDTDDVREAAVLTMIHNWLEEEPFQIMALNIPGRNVETSTTTWSMNPHGVSYEMLNAEAKALFMEIVALLP